VCVSLKKDKEITRRGASLFYLHKGPDLIMGEEFEGVPTEHRFTQTDRVTWLARDLDAFQGEITGLKFYVLDCGASTSAVFEDGYLILSGHLQGC